MRTPLLSLTLSLAAIGTFACARTAPAASPASPAAAASPAGGGASVATERAIFAGGCFWCMESTFEEVAGVKAVTSGYTGGPKENPTYEDHEGDVEAVEVEFDPNATSYEKLLDVFWRNVDPTDATGQFCDRGPAYTSEIFTTGDAQQTAALASKAKVEKTKPFKGEIVTKIVSATKFWPAEEYHQDYYKKNPFRYRFYRQGCGRDARLKQLWGPPER